MSNVSLFAWFGRASGLLLEAFPGQLSIGDGRRVWMADYSDVHRLSHFICHHRKREKKIPCQSGCNIPTTAGINTNPGLLRDHVTWEWTSIMLILTNYKKNWTLADGLASGKGYRIFTDKRQWFYIPELTCDSALKGLFLLPHVKRNQLRWSALDLAFFWAHYTLKPFCLEEVYIPSTAESQRHGWEVLLEWYMEYPAPWNQFLDAARA